MPWLHEAIEVENVATNLILRTFYLLSIGSLFFTPLLLLVTVDLVRISASLYS
jgi:hypothetical protein